MRQFLAAIFLLAMTQVATAHGGHSHGAAPEPATPAAAESAAAAAPDDRGDGACDLRARQPEPTAPGDRAAVDPVAKASADTACN